MSTTSTRPYIIRRITTGYRRNPKQVDGFILINIKNMYEKGRFLLPTVLKGETKYYRFQSWQEYFYTEVRKTPLPFHFYSEYYQGDWFMGVGCNFAQRSWFIDEVARAGLIDEKYRNYNVIAISHDTDLRAYPDRLMMHLSDRILSNYVKFFAVQFGSIVFFDEILRANWQEKLKSSKLRYKIEPDKVTDFEGNRIAMRRMFK